MEEEKSKRSRSLTAGVIVVIILLGLGYAWNSRKVTAPSNKNTAKTPSQKVVIGWVGPLSGDAASYGESLKRAIELARKDMPNANIEVVYEDAGCDTKLVVNAVNKLLTADKVSAIIADLCASPMPLIPLVGQKQVVLMTSIVTIQEYSGASEYAFRVIPSDARQGKVLAELIKARGYTSLGILYSDEEYGRGLQASITENFKKLDGNIVASEAMPLESTDARTQLAKIKSANPDALFVVGLPSGAAAAMKQARALGMAVSFFGPEAFKGQEIIDSAKEAAEGLTITSAVTGGADFETKHKAAYGQESGPYAAQGYDAYTALARAIGTGAATGIEIRDALRTLEFNGLTGHIKFDDKGDIVGDYNIYQIRNGKFELVN